MNVCSLQYHNLDQNKNSTTNLTNFSLLEAHQTCPCKIHWNQLARCQALNHWKNLLAPLYYRDDLHFLFLELFIPKLCLNSLSSALQAISNPNI